MGILIFILSFRFYLVIQSEAKNLGFSGKRLPFLHKHQQNMWPEVTPSGVITFRVMMEILVVVKILRSLTLPLDDRKKETLPLDDRKKGAAPSG